MQDMIEKTKRQNDEGANAKLSTVCMFRDNYYCGRDLGGNTITGAEKMRCGSFTGPACASCKRLQAIEQRKGTLLKQSEWIDLNISSLVTRPNPWTPPGTTIKGYWNLHQIGESPAASITATGEQD